MASRNSCERMGSDQNREESDRLHAQWEILFDEFNQSENKRSLIPSLIFVSRQIREELKRTIFNKFD